MHITEFQSQLSTMHLLPSLRTGCKEVVGTVILPAEMHHAAVLLHAPSICRVPASSFVSSFFLNNGARNCEFHFVCLLNLYTAACNTCQPFFKLGALRSIIIMCLPMPPRHHNPNISASAEGNRNFLIIVCNSSSSSSSTRSTSTPDCIELRVPQSQSSFVAQVQP
jgi:hypothetical protein